MQMDSCSVPPPRPIKSQSPVRKSGNSDLHLDRLRDNCKRMAHRRETESQRGDILNMTLDFVDL